MNCTLRHQRTSSSPFFLDAIIHPISSVRLLPTASQHVGTSAAGAKANREELCFLVVLANGGGQWITHRSTRSLKHLLACIPLLPRCISASELRPPRRSLASIVFSVRNTAHENFEAAVERLLAWLFSEATDFEYGTGSEPRIRDWFAPDDVRRASRDAAQQASQRSALAADPVSAPAIPRRSTSNLLESAAPRAKLVASKPRHIIELDLSDDEDGWASDRWTGRARLHTPTAGGSTPNLLAMGVPVKRPIGGELRVTISHDLLDQRTPVGTPPQFVAPEHTRTALLKSKPSSPPASSPVPISRTPSLRQTRSLKSIRSFGDLKAAAKDSLGMGTKARKKEVVPPVPKVEDWQRKLASPPVSPGRLETAFVIQPVASGDRHCAQRRAPPLFSPPRKPLPAVPTGPRREMPVLKASRSMELLRLMDSTAALRRAHTPAEMQDNDAAPTIPNSSTSSLTVSPSTFAPSSRTSPSPPAIPNRQTSLQPPIRPQSRPTLPRLLSTTTYGATADVVLKLFYPESGSNVLLRVSKSATLEHVKAVTCDKLVNAGGFKLPASPEDWALAYSLADTPPAESEPSYMRSPLQRMQRHNRMASSSTVASSSNTARSSMSSSSGRASTALTVPSLGSHRSATYALVTNEADWKDVMTCVEDGLVVLRIVC